jgi:hypothetical protein
MIALNGVWQKRHAAAMRSARETHGRQVRELRRQLQQQQPYEKVVGEGAVRRLHGEVAAIRSELEQRTAPRSVRRLARSHYTDDGARAPRADSRPPLPLLLLLRASAAARRRVQPTRCARLRRACVLLPYAASRAHRRGCNRVVARCRRVPRFSGARGRAGARWLACVYIGRVACAAARYLCGCVTVRGCRSRASPRKMRRCVAFSRGGTRRARAQWAALGLRRG